MPRYDERPAAPAKIVSASPETIWFARSVITRNAWIARHQRAPASAATTIASASVERRVRVHALDRPEAHHGADEHHPLDAEVEHARALREQLAERREEQRRAVGDAGGDQDDEERVVHAAGSGARAVDGARARAARCACGGGRAARRRAREKRMIPWITPTRPAGKLGALQRVAGVLEAAEQERDERRRRTGCSGRAPRRRCPCSRSRCFCRPFGSPSSAWLKSPTWLAPPSPAIAPDSAITARIFRRMRTPA